MVGILPVASQSRKSNSTNLKAIDCCSHQLLQKAIGLRNNQRWSGLQTKYLHQNATVSFAIGIRKKESRHPPPLLPLLRNLFSILGRRPNLHGSPAKHTKHPRQRRTRCMRRTHDGEFWVPLQAKLLLLQPIVQGLCYELSCTAVPIQWHIKVHAFHLAFHSFDTIMKVSCFGTQHRHATVKQFRPFR